MKILAMSLLLSLPVIACEKGWKPDLYTPSVCVETDAVEPEVKPSDEKPPRNAKPDWETGKVKEIPAKTLDTDDQGKLPENSGVPKR